MDSVLRDIQREKSKMQADVENLHRHHENLQSYIQQYLVQSTVEWARLVVSHPQALLLIIESSPVVDEHGCTSGEREPIRLTACRIASLEILLDQLLHPTYTRDVRGSEYHGLLLSDLVDMPRLADVWPTIEPVLENHPLVVFGADFARDTLRTVVQTRVLDECFCLQNKLKEYYSQFYDLSLEVVLGYQGINQTREQLRDSRDRVLVLVQVVRNLALALEKQVKVHTRAGSTDSFLDDDLGDLDAHPF